MNNVKRLCASVALTLALAMSVFAGQIDIGKTPPPPPPTLVTAAGQIDTGVASSDATPNGETTAESLTEITLNLLQSVLALF